MTDFDEVIQQMQAWLQAGATVDVNFKMPTVAVVHPDGRNWFFQGDEAEDLIERANASEVLTFEEYVLWESTGWT